MKYSPQHDAFLLTQDELKSAALMLKYIMQRARKIAGVPFGKRKCEGGLQEIDHLEKGLLEMATDIGIDFGVSWGSDLDVSDVK